MTDTYTYRGNLGASSLTFYMSDVTAATANNFQMVRTDVSGVTVGLVDGAGTVTGAVWNAAKGTISAANIVADSASVGSMSTGALVAGGGLFLGAVSAPTISAATAFIQDLSTGSAIQGLVPDPGPLIETNYSYVTGPYDRFGIGQFENGALRLYASQTLGIPRIMHSFIDPADTTGNTYNDYIIVTPNTCNLTTHFSTVLIEAPVSVGIISAGGATFGTVSVYNTIYTPTVSATMISAGTISTGLLYSPAATIDSVSSGMISTTAVSTVTAFVQDALIIGASTGTISSGYVTATNAFINYLSTGGTIQVLTPDPGPMIETNYAYETGPYDRFGIGQFPVGVLRIYASGNSAVDITTIAFIDSNDTTGNTYNDYIVVATSTFNVSAHFSTVLIEAPVSVGIISAGGATFGTISAYNTIYTPAISSVTISTGGATFDTVSVYNTIYTPAISAIAISSQYATFSAVSAFTTIQYPPVNVGAMIEARYGANDRYGMGQFFGGITRVYASVYNPATIALSFVDSASIDGALVFDDAVVINHSAIVTTSLLEAAIFECPISVATISAGAISAGLLYSPAAAIDGMSSGVISVGGATFNTVSIYNTIYTPAVSAIVISAGAISTGLLYTPAATIDAVSSALVSTANISAVTGYVSAAIVQIATGNAVSANTVSAGVVGVGEATISTISVMSYMSLSCPMEIYISTDALQATTIGTLPGITINQMNNGPVAAPAMKINQASATGKPIPGTALYISGGIGQFDNGILISSGTFTINATSPFNAGIVLTGYAGVTFQSSAGIFFENQEATDIALQTTGQVNAGLVNTDCVSVGAISTTSIACDTISCFSVTAAAYVTVSDVRFKKNITIIENALSTVAELRGVFYQRRDAPVNSSSFELGLIAQEVERAMPAVVTTDAHEPHYKAVCYDRLVGILIEAVKELRGRLEKIENCARAEGWEF